MSTKFSLLLLPQKLPEEPIQFSSVINQPIYNEYWGGEKKKNSRRINIPLDFILKSFEVQWSPLRQEPEAPYNNATSRELRRIPPPAGDGGFQVTGLKADHKIWGVSMKKLSRDARNIFIDPAS